MLNNIGFKNHFIRFDFIREISPSMSIVSLDLITYDLGFIEPFISNNPSFSKQFKERQIKLIFERFEDLM